MQNQYDVGTGDGTYPGNQYVDVVAFTVYGNPLGFNNGKAVRDVTGNNTLIACGKPIGVAEINPHFRGLRSGHRLYQQPSPLK